MVKHSIGRLENQEYQEAEQLHRQHARRHHALARHRGEVLQHGVALRGLVERPAAADRAHRGDFVLTDAGDYTTPGTVHYFHADGSLVWSHTAGVCPSRIAWVYGAE